MNQGPSLSYVEIITGLEGPQRVPLWQTLATALEDRLGWHFTIAEAEPLWKHRQGNTWATVDVLGPGRFVLWHCGAVRYATRSGGTGRWETRTVGGGIAAVLGLTAKAAHA